MKTRLFGIVTAIELVLAGLLVFILSQEAVPDKTAALLVWLLPMAFGLHVLEEFAFPGGFGEWSKLYRPQFAAAMAPSYLIKVNAIPGVAAMLVPLGVFNYAGGYSFFGVRAWHAFLAILAFNAMDHMRGAIVTKRYSPGVLTGIFLYLPLTVISCTYFLKTGAIDIYSVLGCLMIGSVFQSVLDLVKKRSLKEGGAGT